MVKSAGRITDGVTMSRVFRQPVVGSTGSFPFLLGVWLAGPADGDVAVKTKPLRFQLFLHPGSDDAGLLELQIIVSVVAAAMRIGFEEYVNVSPLRGRNRSSGSESGRGKGKRRRRGEDRKHTFHGAPFRFEPDLSGALERYNLG